MRKSPYHSGELEVQARAGVLEMAARIGNGIHSSIPPVAEDFLRGQRLAVLGTVDRDGRVWASLVTGSPGFIQAMDERTVRIDATPTSGDPLMENLEAGGEAGMIVIDFATRRRMRLNGHAEARPGGGILLRAKQVYSNCPKYIQARVIESQTIEPEIPPTTRRASSLSPKQQSSIMRADTFFIAGFHNEGGADASHRGGNPGFVRVLNDRELLWPDYSGNNMFQTLGNISARTEAGLLFIDFERGSTLQITGKAGVIWDRNRAAEFAGAERLVEFRVDEVIEAAGATRLRWRFVDYSRFNPD
ncbi:MAG: pyridoxamine 5'-phosphate oxidase family protein [Blastocatellia bacterium]|nr:pyridoxamine 5'-phosphate oxidase family protein [Blastocatellia bacterium]